MPKQVNCLQCNELKAVSPCRIDGRNHFCDDKCRTLWLKTNSHFITNNPNKGRIYSKEEREYLGTLRRGKRLSWKHKESNQNWAKKNEWVFKNLKNVDLSRKRVCKWGKCSNFVYGNQNYCQQHLLLTLEGKIANRIRASLYYVGLKSKDVSNEVKIALTEAYKAKEKLNGYHISCKGSPFASIKRSCKVNMGSDR